MPGLTIFTHDFIEHASRAGGVLAVSLFIYILLGRIVPRVLRLGTARARGRELTPEETQRTRTIARVFVHAGGLTALTMGLLMALSEVSLNIAPVLAGAGIVGLAIAFGAQNFVKDIIGGIFVLLEDQYSVGDVVKIGETAGLVEDFNLRRTVLRDMDGVVHFVPNGEVRIASNLSKDFARVNLDISIGYGEDIDRAVDVINAVGADLANDAVIGQEILEAPQVLRVEDLGDSAVEIKVLGTTRRLQQWAVAGELRRRIKQAFDREGIEIPFPHVAVVPKGDWHMAADAGTRRTHNKAHT